MAGRLISGAEDADATVAEAEELVEASGRIAHNLRRMVRTVGQVERAVQLRESSAQTDLVAGDDDAPTARDDGKARRRQQRRGALTPFQRVLASRSARRSTRSTLMPKRMLIRVIYQILTDKARSAPSETMPNYVYDYFLQMYGIKNLAERHLASFIASIKATADAAPRCALFAGLIGLSAVPMSADEADLVTSLYAALQKESFSAAAVAAKEQLEEMDDGRIWCCVPAALRAVAALFKQVDTVRPESYKRLTSAVEAQQRTDKRGRAVADVDEVVRAVAGTWAAERADFREQVSALFAAGDVNGDGVLSFGEFRAIMELVAPAVVHDELRILHAFRECLARADEADEAKREDERRRDRDGGDGDDDDDAEEERAAKGEAAAKRKGGGGGGGGPERKGVRVEAVGIDSGVFVKVLEDLGLLGVRGAREMESARTSLLHQQREYQREHKEQQQQPGSPSRGRGDGGGSPNSPDALRRGGSSHGGSQSASPEGRRSGRGGESRRRRPRWRRRGRAHGGGRSTFRCCNTRGRPTPRRCRRRSRRCSTRSPRWRRAAAAAGPPRRTSSAGSASSSTSTSRRCRSSSASMTTRRRHGRRSATSRSSTIGSRRASSCSQKRRAPPPAPTMC